MRTPIRAVTGHDAAGRSVFLSIGEAPQAFPREGIRYHELWRTHECPSALGPAPPPEPPVGEGPVKLGPEGSGSVIRFVDLEPGHIRHTAPRSDGRNPGMHRTQTLDYGILIEGEIYAIVGDEELRLLPGDVVIQRGTDHAWENRGDKPARIAFILLPAVFTAELAALLPGVQFQYVPLPSAEP